jgi:6-phosphogluconate dehydrogenase
MRAGLHAVVYDPNPEAVKALASEGATPATDLSDLVAQLPVPRVVWVMVPAGEITQKVVTDLAGLLQAGDILIDGGNSYYRDDIARAAICGRNGIHFLDVGTSGGVWGLDRGYCLMIGGADEPVSYVRPLWESLSPGVDAAPRTYPDSAESDAEHGWLHCGPSGAGHFVKMVHNGIEYGLMAAYAEGFNILKHANAGLTDRATDAETAPLSNPEFYQYNLDIPAIAELWRRGSVVESWLLDLSARALAGNPELTEFSGRVSDSGEGRWTSIAAIDEGVPAPVLTSALFERFSSQGKGDFAGRLLSAMRKEFGGHEEKSAE